MQAATAAAPVAPVATAGRRRSHGYGDGKSPASMLPLLLVGDLGSPHLSAENFPLPLLAVPSPQLPAVPPLSGDCAGHTSPQPSENMYFPKQKDCFSFTSVLFLDPNP